MNRNKRIIIALDPFGVQGVLPIIMELLYLYSQIFLKKYYLNIIEKISKCNINTKIILFILFY